MGMALHSNSKPLVEIWLCHLVHINSDSQTWEDNELVKSLCSNNDRNDDTDGQQSSI